MKPRWHPDDAPRIVEIVRIGVDLVLQEPAHLGGADPDASSDRPLLRNADGVPYLSGTSLKGVLRSTVGRSDKFDELFGNEFTGRDAAARVEGQAAFFVDDAPLADAVPIELRDGVAIDPKTGTPEKKKKFDLELLPAGTRFRATFELNLGADEVKRTEHVRRALALLHLLEEGVEVGGRTRRGFGAIKSDPKTWTLRRFDLGNRVGMRAWVALGMPTAPSGWASQAQTVPALSDLPGLLGVTDFDLDPPRAVSIALDLRVAGSICIRSGGVQAGAADNIHLHAISADWKGNPWPVVPGTSLAGVLRARATRITRTLFQGRGADGDRHADDLVEGLFGPRVIQGGNARAGRLRVSETPIEEGRLLRHTRLRVDPFTGGASDALLFTNDALFGGTLAPKLKWTPPPPNDAPRERAEKGLLLLLLRDLAAGDLPVGGETGTGRGRLAPRTADGRFGTFGGRELRLTGHALNDVDGWQAAVTALVNWRLA